MRIQLNESEIDHHEFLLAGFDNSLLTLSVSIAAQLPRSLTREQRDAITCVVRTEIENARDAISEFSPAERLG
ncbi:hypothetical protein ACFL2H_00440 [Planctomycetota bacterium]